MATPKQIPDVILHLANKLLEHQLVSLLRGTSLVALKWRLFQRQQNSLLAWTEAAEFILKLKGHVIPILHGMVIYTHCGSGIWFRDKDTTG